MIKTELKPTMQAINAALIDTLAACGDVNRNVAVAANPLQSHAHAAVHAQAAALSEHLLPNTRAYYEIWLDEERVAGSGSEDEPIYGATYLPRKFKIGFAMPPYNDVDVFAQDLGFIAIVDDDGALAGYNVSVGGGMGATHGDPETYPRLGDVIGFVTPDQVIAVGEAVVTAQRDYGNRNVRKRARLKYTIDDRGLDWFKAEVERRAGFTLPPARPFDFAHNGDRFGWIEGEDGRAHLTLRIVAGRIWDHEGVAAPERAARDRTRAGGRRDRRRVPPHAQPEPGDRRRPRRAAQRASMRWSTQYGTGRLPHAPARCGATRWPASPCRPAAWRWPRPSATCPN